MAELFRIKCKAYRTTTGAERWEFLFKGDFIVEHERDAVYGKLFPYNDAGKASSEAAVRFKLDQTEVKAGSNSKRVVIGNVVNELSDSSPFALNIRMKRGEEAQKVLHRLEEIVSTGAQSEELHQPVPDSPSKTDEASASGSTFGGSDAFNGGDAFNTASMFDTSAGTEDPFGFGGASFDAANSSFNVEASFEAGGDQNNGESPWGVPAQGMTEMSFNTETDEAGATSMFDTPATGQTTVATTSGGGDDADDVDDSKLKLPDEVIEGEQVASGHEEEDELFKSRTVMHRFFAKHVYGETTRENIWFDCGKGDLHVYKHKKTGVVRVVFRQEITLKVKANFRVEGVLATQSATKKTRVMINGAHTLDEDNEVEVANLAFRFRSAEKAEELLALLEQYSKSSEATTASSSEQQAASPAPAPAPAPVSADHTESKQDSEDTAPASNLDMFGASSGGADGLFGSNGESDVFAFGDSGMPSEDNDEPPSMFGDFGSGDNAFPGLSEGGGFPGFGDGGDSSNNAFSFDPSGDGAATSSIFSNGDASSAAVTTETGGGDDADDVDDSKLKLPDEVIEGEQVASGHEEEDELFKCRTVMHRFFAKHVYGETTRENIWFDCGKGDVHVYKHKKTGVVRVVFRQEITLKVKANFRVEGVLATQSATKKTRVMINGAHTLDEDNEVEVANLAFRFRTAEKAEELLALLAQYSNGTSTDTGAAAGVGSGSSSSPRAPAAATTATATTTSPAAGAQDEHIDGPAAALFLKWSDGNDIAGADNFKALAADILAQFGHTIGGQHLARFVMDKVGGEGPATLSVSDYCRFYHAHAADIDKHPSPERTPQDTLLESSVRVHRFVVDNTHASGHWSPVGAAEARVFQVSRTGAAFASFSAGGSELFSFSLVGIAAVRVQGKRRTVIVNLALCSIGSSHPDFLNFAIRFKTEQDALRFVDLCDEHCHNTSPTTLFCETARMAYFIDGKWSDAGVGEVVFSKLPHAHVGGLSFSNDAEHTEFVLETALTQTAPGQPGDFFFNGVTSRGARASLRWTFDSESCAQALATLCDQYGGEDATVTTVCVRTFALLRPPVQFAPPRSVCIFVANAPNSTTLLNFAVRARVSAPANEVVRCVSSALVQYRRWGSP